MFGDDNYEVNERQDNKYRPFTNQQDRNPYNNYNNYNYNRYENNKQRVNQEYERGCLKKIIQI